MTLLASKGLPDLAVIAFRLLLFVLGSFVPFVGYLASVGRSTGETEKRVMAARPELPRTKEALVAFPHAFESFANDAFPHRDRLIELHGKMMLEVMGKSPVPHVIIGNDGWLFYAHKGDGDPIGALLGIEPKDGEAIATATAANTRRVHEWLAARKIPFYALVPPNKERIYREHMPPAMRMPSQGGSGFDLVSRVAAEVRAKGVRFLDLRPVLLERKGRYPLYRKTDTHWNAYGALVGAEALFDEIRKTFPATPLLRGQPTGTVPTGPGDLAVMMGLASSFEDVDVTLAGDIPSEDIVKRLCVDESPTRIRCENAAQPNAPRVVIWRDSFSGLLVPYLAYATSSVLIVFEIPFDGRVVEAFRPDLVIFENVERYFPLNLGREPILP